MTTEKALSRVFKKNPVPNGEENRVYKKKEKV
ncbi:MAG: hypothetical protein HW390_3545 [Candidatus Brocadiaceae bacterium]|nr:hypothetical protein [Candidatus Brocadiaceae bacterium]